MSWSMEDASGVIVTDEWADKTNSSRVVPLRGGPERKTCPLHGIVSPICNDCAIADPFPSPCCPGPNPSTKSGTTSEDKHSPGQEAVDIISFSALETLMNIEYYTHQNSTDSIQSDESQ